MVHCEWYVVYFVGMGPGVVQCLLCEVSWVCHTVLCNVSCATGCVVHGAGLMLHCVVCDVWCAAWGVCEVCYVTCAVRHRRCFALCVVSPVIPGAMKEGMVSENEV